MKPFFSLIDDGITEVLFYPDIAWRDFRLHACMEGGYLLLMCRGHEVALISAMGCSVERFHFADGYDYSIEEMLDLLAGHEDSFCGLADLIAEENVGAGGTASNSWMAEMKPREDFASRAEEQAIQEMAG